MHNPENERIKRAYFFYLKEARRPGEHSVDCAAAALAKFEDYTKFRDFKRFHIQQAIGFKRMLSDQISPRTGEQLSRGTVFSTLNALRGFFLWLATQPGYRSHLTPADAEYFSLSDKDARIAKAALDRPVPTIEQIRHVLKSMPADTDIELRNSRCRCLYPAYRCSRRRDRLAEAQARRRPREQGGTRCAGGAHQVLQDLHDMVLPGRRRHSPDCRGLGRIPYRGEAVRTRRSIVSGYSSGPRPRPSVPGGRPVASALVECHADQDDLQRAPDCGTPTHIPFAKHWRSSASASVGPQRNSRPGARTWVTSR